MNNRKSLLRLTIAILAILMVFASCEEPEDPIDRVQNFVDDLRAQKYSALYTHFSSNASQYDAIKLPTFWSGTNPFDGINYVISSYSTSGSTVTASIAYVDEFSTPTTETWTFTTEEDDLTWRIRSLATPGYTID